MIRLRFFVLVLLALASCDAAVVEEVATATATKVVSEASLGPVRATVRIPDREFRFGDRFALELEVVASQGAQLEPIEFTSRLGHLRIRDRRDDSDLANGRLAHTVVVEPERTGTNLARLPIVRFTPQSGEGAGRRSELALEGFRIEVAGLTAGEVPDLGSVATALGAVPLPLPGDAQRTLWIVLGAIAALLMLSLWWWRSRRVDHSAMPVVIDPHAEAEAAFASLLARDLPGRGLFAEFYVGLTGIVRRFVERTTGIHAPEQTTEEFLRALEHDERVARDRKSELRNFLAASDLVKYAAQVPSATELDDAVQSAKRFCARNVGAEVTA
ncbi:MAG: hypothetical protein AB7I19_09665 [Planctomycetota bacterium]